MEYNQQYKPLVDYEKGGYEKTDYDHTQYDVKSKRLVMETKNFTKKPYPNPENFYDINMTELNFWIQELIYRATPMFVTLVDGDVGICGHCNNIVVVDSDLSVLDYGVAKFCSICGQALKWPVKK